MEVKIRPARAGDKPPLMSFIKDVWGGHDYIPDVWDSWLKDPEGRMFVVEVDGRPVGMNRVRFLEDGSAWFEGARVHPDFRGMGLASMLGENSMELAKIRGVGVFRLTSGSTNKVAHRQIARIKFKEVARFSVYEPPKGKKLRPSTEPELVGMEGVKEALRAIRDSKEYKLGTGVLWHDFTAAGLTPAVVAKLVGEGSVWRAGRAVAVRRIGGAHWEEICFIGGPVEEALGLVDSLIGRDKGAKERWVFLPKGSPLIHMLRMRGFIRNFSMILFQRRAANG